MASTSPHEQFDLAIVLVHGIGEQDSGDTLESAVNAFVDWFDHAHQQTLGHIPEHTRLSAKIVHVDPHNRSSKKPRQAILKVTLTSAPSNVTTTQRWLIVEASWAKVFRAPTFSEVRSWIVSVAPLLLTHHFYKRALIVTDPVRRSTWPISLLERPIVAAMLLLRVLLVPAMLLLLVALPLFTLLPKVGGYASKCIDLAKQVLGDSYVLLSNESRRTQILGHVASIVTETRARSRSLCLVGHSQGAAIAHYVLRELNPGAVGSFITFGSAFEKLAHLEILRTSIKLPRVRSTPFILFLIGCVATFQSSGWIGLVLTFWFTILASLNLPLLRSVAAFLSGRRRWGNAPVLVKLFGYAWTTGQLVFFCFSAWLAHATASLFLVPVDVISLCSLGISIAAALWVLDTVDRLESAMTGSRDTIRKAFEHIANANLIDGMTLGPIVIPRTWRIHGWVPWKNMYAANDPVPNGPIFLHEYLGLQHVVRGIMSTEEVVHNRASLLTDHTSYWKNLDQFVTRVVWQALLTSQATSPGSSLDGALVNIAARADRERPRRLRWLKCARLAILLCTAFCALMAVDRSAQVLPLTHMLLAALPDWQVLGIGTWIRESLHPEVVSRLLVALLIAICGFVGCWGAATSWERWDTLAMRQCIRGEQPDQQPRKHLFALYSVLGGLLPVGATAMLVGGLLTSAN
jgi:hypothetical protein